MNVPVHSHVFLFDDMLSYRPEGRDESKRPVAPAGAFQRVLPGARFDDAHHSHQRCVAPYVTCTGRLEKRARELGLGADRREDGGDGREPFLGCANNA